MRLAMLLIVSAAPALAKADERVLEPSSIWQLDYGEQKCRLGRVFGTGETRTALLLDQFGPGNSFIWTVAGSAVKALRRNRDVEVQFGPAFPAFSVSQNEGLTLGNLGPAITGDGYDRPDDISTHLPEADRPATAEANDGPPSGAAPPADNRRNLDLADGAKIDRLVLSQKGRDTTVLRLGKMERTFKAMNACTENLVQSWGLDPVELRSQATPIVWQNQRELVRTIVGKYPGAAMRAGNQANFLLRIIVAADGSVAKCLMTAQTLAENFQDTVCPIIESRGRFEPARDASGRGIKSIYTTRVVYRIAP